MNGRTQKENILVVDDEEPLLRFLAEVLERSGYTVLKARHGEEALALSDNFPGPIHLLVTDVMMPVMNGKELADRLCSLRPDIKVLFISGFDRREIFPEDVCEDEVVDWLPKPFSVRQFHRKVKRVLGAVGKE